MRKLALIVLLVCTSLQGRPRYESVNTGLIAHYKLNENTASDNAELVVNGDFADWTDDDPDGWTVGYEAGAGDPGTRDPEISQVGTGEDHTDAGGETGGMCNIYSSDQGPIVSQTVTLVVGKKYRLSINFDTITTAKLRVYDISYDQWPAFTSDAPGVHSVDFVCTNANTSLLIEDETGAVDVTIDDVSIKLCAAEDSSGGDHDGLLAEDTDAAHVAGKIDGSFDFDGAADYIDIGNHAGSVKSVAMWVNPDAIDVTDYVIDLNGNVYAYIDNGVLKAGVGLPPTQILYVDGEVGTAVTANWHFIAWTSTVGFTASDLDIGRLEGSGYFDGLIDNVMLFSTKLTPSQVSKLYNSGRGTEAPDTLRERY